MKELLKELLMVTSILCIGIIAFPLALLLPFLFWAAFNISIASIFFYVPTFIFSYAWFNTFYKSKFFKKYAKWLGENI